MKLYIVKGEHPHVPGQPQKATFDKSEADAFAADLVSTIAQDMGAAEVDRPEAWRDRLKYLQARAYSIAEAVAFSDALATIEAEGADALDEDGFFDVWIEETEVDLPAPVQPRTAFIGSYDGRDGMTLHLAYSEEAMIDWLLGKAGKTRAEFDAFASTGVVDPEYPDVVKPEGERGISDYLPEHGDYLDTCQWDQVNLPQEGAAVAFARSIEDSFGPMFDDDARWSNVSGGDAVEWLGGLIEDARKVLAGQPAAKADLAIILEGGCVQNVTMRGGPEPRVFVVDYDSEGADAVDGVPQDDGDIAEAIISEPAIDYASAGDDAFWRALADPQPPEIACGQCEGTGTITGGLSGDGDDEECPVCDGTGTIANPVFEGNG